MNKFTDVTRLHHFCQAIIRKKGNCGVKSLYRKNQRFKKLIKMVLNLVLIPVDRVKENIDKIRTQLIDLSPVPINYI